MAKDLESSKKPTLYLVQPWTELMKKHIKKNQLDSYITTQMKNSLSKYYGECISQTLKLSHKTAIFLHPLFKNLKSFTDEEKIEVHEAVKSTLRQNSQRQIEQASNDANNGTPPLRRIVRRTSTSMNETEVNPNSTIIELQDETETAAMPPQKKSAYDVYAMFVSDEDDSGRVSPTDISTNIDSELSRYAAENFSFPNSLC